MISFDIYGLIFFFVGGIDWLIKWLISTRWVVFVLSKKGFVLILF